MFGSVDSEQSVPRTAPLATPEQDMSLMENFSFDNDPMNEVFQMDTVHESTNGHNDRIPTVQEDQSVEEDTPHFNVEITPPQTSEPEGATCLPDVVP